MRKIGNVLETTVVVAIVLVLAHTLLDDLSILAGWTVEARRWIIWSGLGFDLFFTAEFFTRLYAAIARGEGGAYFLRQRGWIDFLASIPLLLLNSLPNAMALLAGTGLVMGVGSFLNILKVIKAVRIARILRLLRVIKLFRGIRYARSPLAQRHLATIITISVTVLVAWTIGATIMQSVGVLPGLEGPYAAGQSLRMQAIVAGDNSLPALTARAAAIASLDPGILAVRLENGPTIYSRYDTGYYASRFLPGDYGYRAENGVEIYLDERPVAQAAAREAFIFFVAVLLTVMGFLFFYAPRFALGISDPVYIMKRGMEEKDYNLEVRIPAEEANDDVFALAALYNAVFLPLKDREGRDSDETKSTLSIDDVRDLVEKG
jgi:hypothetical protein